jgi:hypothetical protein
VFHPRKLSRIAPVAILLIAAILPASASAASSACAGTSADQAQVADAMRTMYAAATTDDLDKFHTVAAPDFYAFDGGRRYDGDALMKMVKSSTTAARYSCGRSPNPMSNPIAILLGSRTLTAAR